MDPTDQSPEEMYSVWALPRHRPWSHASPPLRHHRGVLDSLYTGPTCVIVVIVSAAAGLRPFTARVASIGRYGVNLLLEPTREMMATSDHCRAHFDYQRPAPYVPHLSLLYGDHLTEEEKAAARKKAGEMDKGIFGLQFEISELALYKTDPKDKSLESWELVELCHLQKK
ncbi:unnamed protein product [Triticum turgidum subsp. durum]|uniref:Cyclic phosphodiesterase n=1 Tax=Triticum turgidum subsp. durum TaxID=4567 RepID=A0A9R1BKV5_TRITD|nr:unnamed protein product [Triticum turgidum subsp. durum]